MSSDSNLRKALCPVCASTDVRVFVEVLQVPVHCNLLWPTREEALGAPRGDIRLGFCGRCGHVFNLAFDPERMHYAQEYENSLHFSPRFQRYAESLAARLIDRYELHDKDIIEIGCGQGEFLTLLCKLGDNRGVGFDPSYVPQRTDEALTGQVTFIQDFYSERYLHHEADFVCCRHVLEHIADPVDFLTVVRRAIGNRPNTVVFFEVPNVLSTLRDLAIWDIIYEHCSYFSPNSLARAFGACGFVTQHLAEAFEGQFLSLEALPGTERSGSWLDLGGDLEQLAHHVALFASEYRAKVETWQRSLDRIAGTGQQAVVWGAGSKGVTFLNTLKPRNQLGYAVDINPHKEGMYIAGTGQRIVPPQFLRDHPPDVVIVMNPIYKREIQEQTRSLGLDVDFLYA
jgi:2-polyprenyl-3-methyl-5-hydroxy-6-metoxy-1,4-benzoquinol methylase